MLSKIKNKPLKLVFIILLILCSIYVAFIKTSFYESTASITIKNLDDSTTTNTSLIGLVNGNSSNNTQEAMILQEYLKSYEVYNKVDKKFDLSNYYRSDDLDFLQRMHGFNSYEDYVKLYDKQLSVNYDETSNITTISFLHIDAKTAQDIVNFLINEAETKLNEYNKQTAKKQLVFVQNETNKQKEILEESIKELETYQNSQKIIDPNAQAQANTALLAQLKVKLIESQSKLERVSKYLTSSAFEVVDLKREISQIKKSINKITKEQAGSNTKTLNKSIFDYERIKAKVDLNTDLYKQALLQLQTSRLEANKDNRVLQILINPNLAQSYSQPDRLRELITVILVLTLLYGILSMISAIIKDHRE